MLNIQPIKLLKGCHPKTGDTGHGCFLNVCSYLQGDKLITDKPSSVNSVLRAPIIVINDSLHDGHRQALIPFVHRAMLTGEQDGLSNNAALDRLIPLAEMTRELLELALDTCVPARHPNDFMAEAMSRNHPVALAEVVARNICMVLALLYKLGPNVRYWKPLEISDYVKDAPLTYAMNVGCRPAIDRAVEIIVEGLDRALPSDVEPRPIVAARAALLVEVKKEWGNKPLPRNQQEAMWAGTKSGLSIYDELTGLEKYVFFNVGVDSAAPGVKDVTLYAKEPPVKKNTPHGPVKKHKPLYI